MSKVITFSGMTRLDIPVDRIIEGAKIAELESIVIIGYDKDGDMYFASSKANGGDILWLLENAKLELLDPTHN